MIKEIEITVFPDNRNNEDLIKKLIVKQLKINESELKGFLINRESLDSRKKPIYKLRVSAFINELLVKQEIQFDFKNVEKAKSAIIVGSGPAGLFAALRLLELGIKPIVFERGKNVRDRRFDLKDILQNGNVNENSNYCFGEGGAGTYSDGKLYTRSNKRGDISRIINMLIYHGAKEEISYQAHPHLGSNKLPKIVENIRNTITKYGGEIHFNSKVTDFVILENKIKGVIVNNQDEKNADAVIVATGHSARDIFEIYDKHNLTMEAKPFAVGVRIEHPQQIIDSIQYKIKTKPLSLPSASYSLVNNIGDKGVFSFCMCPGGIVIPASTNSDELVLNGMSVSKRNSPFANSGLVVTVDKRDWVKYKKFGHFAGLKYQEEIERLAFDLGGGNQVAAAQRVTDFVYKRASKTLPLNSYIPGIKSVELHEALPKVITENLRKSVKRFDSKMKGYFTSEAIIMAAETRTSSPVRIIRGKENHMQIDCEGLFPSGEGAGYAGGIVSAAIDGENVANSVSKYLFKN